MTVTLAAELARAIRECRMVRFSYLKNPRRTAPRVVHPHVLFVAAGGDLRLDALQVAGPTSGDGSLPAWRTFDVPLIRRLQSLARHFERDPRLDLSTPKYRRVLAHCDEGGRAT